MLLLVAGTYLATYGPGRVAVHLLGLKVRSFQERLGISCAVGAVILGWVGYFGARAAAPGIVTAGGWLAIVLGVLMVVRGLTWAKESCDLALRHRLILGLGIALGLGFAAAMNYWQIAYHPDGSLSGRFVWPDLLYRNAIMSRLMACDGFMEWPWLADTPLKGMSLLRYAAMTPIFKALFIPATQYQVAALWLGLFGVPVAACTALALFRALGAGRTVGAWAVVLTGFLGNPRWLLNDMFAHSPALHWAGTDVFAISVPVLLAMLALIVLTLRRAPGALWLAVLLLASGTGHAPWLSLAVYAAVPMYFLASLVGLTGSEDRRRAVRDGLVLTAAALLGIVVLKVLMGSGTGGGSLLAAIGPSPTIRRLSWAFPFLAEPLRPLLGDPGPAALLKLIKFCAVYAFAVLFYLGGSMWVRNVILPSAYRFQWRRLREPVWAFGLCLAIAGILLSSVINFNRLAYQGAQYDVYRVLWPALLLANLAVALLLVEKWPLLRRGWGLALLAVLIFYGSWENVQLVYWSRAALPVSVVAADEMAALRHLDAQAQAGDVVFINPRHEPGPAPSPQRHMVGHNWGYVSGLLPLRVWLDNEDMARKFGQGRMWDARLAMAQRAMAGPPQDFRSFLDRNGIGWVLAQDERLAEQSAKAGLRRAFQSGAVSVWGRSGSGGRAIAGG